jgi:hypothetical protein
MTQQTTSTLLMIEPVAFGFNYQTADNNYFQQEANSPASAVQEKALQEFRQMVALLQDKGLDLIVVRDTPEPHTPDSIFPNNWISFHEDGNVVLYPMFAENRRLERRPDILKQIEKEGFIIQNVVDYSAFEKKNIFLEGTGSMVLDRLNRIAYAALSERTHLALFLQFCEELHFTPCSFFANQTVGTQRLPIYHTNVMMSVGDRYAVVCLDAIDDETERQAVAQSFRDTGKEIIEITEAQMHRFAGNMLQVENREGKKRIVLSETAHRSLTAKQIERLGAFGEIVSIPIPTIEQAGGGSVRCMLAEIFLQKEKTI